MTGLGKDITTMVRSPGQPRRFLPQPKMTNIFSKSKVFGGGRRPLVEERDLWWR